ncbi:MAG: glycosyltransferase family 4 protein [Nonlabens sp.]|uniref:glycosyltransferase family 4 protein n=1 Tax=Nonlabens sp. TaxID=1888209 RepID=UPI003EF81A4B
MKNLLVVGPFPLPITGVSLGTQIVYDEFYKKPEYKVQKVNTSYSKFDEKIGELSFHKVFFYLRLQIYFFKVFKNDIIYITIGQSFYGVIKYALYILAAHVSGKQLVIHIHGNFLGRNYRENLTGVKKKIFRYLMSKPDKGIVSSDSLKPNFTSFLPDHKIYSLKNFIIDELFVPDDVISDKDYDTIKIVYLSNLMLEKGIFELLEALVILEEKGIKYEARIAGNIAPENKDRVLSLFNKLNHATYIGTVNVVEKKDLLIWSNIFILPTFYTMEAQPFAILESMATGNMVITTPHAGIPDIFEENLNGLYVEKNSIESLVSTIEHIAQNKNLIKKYGLHNVEEARSKYRIPNFISELEQIFNK